MSLITEQTICEQDYNPKLLCCIEFILSASWLHYIFCDEFGGCSSVYYYYYYCSYSFYTETLKTQKGLRVTVASEEDDTKKNLRYGKKKQSYVYTVRY